MRMCMLCSPLACPFAVLCVQARFEELKKRGPPPAAAAAEAADGADKAKRGSGRKRKN